mmetsp:Transcript_14522/g.41811  ORF Transcript_14522/g.41811 Transcript_14522/m.41811 type:complete len:480 (-) Transcript_14522:175-1614(-)
MCFEMTHKRSLVLLLSLPLLLLYIPSSQATPERTKINQAIPSPPRKKAGPSPAASTWTGATTPTTANGRALDAGDDDDMGTDSVHTLPSDNEATPVYKFKHGQGIFTVASGTGCYEGAKGQAQARFDIVHSVVDLFVPSVFRMLNKDSVPQDTVLNKVNNDNDGQRHLAGQQAGDDVDATGDAISGDESGTTNRKEISHECVRFQSGKDSFDQMTIVLEELPNDGGNVQDSSTTHHRHGIFKAKEEWFEGLKGQYSLTCIHHECIMLLLFSSADCEAGACDSSESRNLFANGEKGVTSLKLQGTTELAYQGADIDMLVCVENCDAGGSDINMDAEFTEVINVRAFDNHIVQVHSSHSKAPKAAKGAGTKAPKASKAPKAAKSANGGKGKGKGKGGKGTAQVVGGCSVDSDCSDDGLFCTGTETCVGGSCQAGGSPCTAPTPVCDEGNDECVECLTADQCPQPGTCTNIEGTRTCEATGA